MKKSSIVIMFFLLALFAHGEASKHIRGKLILAQFLVGPIRKATIEGNPIEGRYIDIMSEHEYVWGDQGCDFEELTNFISKDCDPASPIIIRPIESAPISSLHNLLKVLRKHGAIDIRIAVAKEREIE